MSFELLVSITIFLLVVIIYCLKEIYFNNRASKRLEEKRLKRLEVASPEEMEKVRWKGLDTD